MRTLAWPATKSAGQGEDCGDGLAEGVGFLSIPMRGLMAASSWISPAMKRSRLAKVARVS